MTVSLPHVRFGRDRMTLADAGQLEWLVTNGQGSYASASLLCHNTRGYHGLLVSALQPPVGRMLVLPTLIEKLVVGEKTYDLSTIVWSGGWTAPEGYVWIEEVRFEGTLPTWRLSSPDFVLEKSLWMVRDQNTLAISYNLTWAREDARLEVSPITAARDYHSREYNGDPYPEISVYSSVLSVKYPNIDQSLFVHIDGATVTTDGTVYRGFDLPKERERGLTDAEDHILAGQLACEIKTDKTITLVANIGSAPATLAPESRDAEVARQLGVIDTWHKAKSLQIAPEWVKQLVLASDQFIVARTRNDGSNGKTIIAGYHWFADWGRDTMISISGTCLTTGEYDIARDILMSFADVIDGGMVPNRFPDGGEAPEYNTVDATFWFITAVRDYVETSGDKDFLKQMMPVFADIVEHLEQGTRYNIHIDPNDGLISAGSDGVQLTWMDARVGDWVVTPRRGKPIEVNAKWIEGLTWLSNVAKGDEANRYSGLLEHARKGFQRFWNEETGYCFDVIDGPDGDDATLRPNQIFAARPDIDLLTQEQAEAVVSVCERNLLTPAGLRSLAPFENGYTLNFTGASERRDAAYHQGTVWGWLIGPFIEAHLATFKAPKRSAQILAPFADQLRVEGIGTINEVFEAAEPHAPKGCIAQAWSVGEVLRAWHLIRAAQSSKTARKV
ncbi:amylo-alpha-1,6-glucosidase [Marivita sp.]|jgi:predicted glycogen debranching enzyme|uniref:amylo-alpha-1,6-glucosidase n=1 Tax=Marivita sp. TaxID=2003365 RepID=UPI003B5BF4CA